MKQRDLYEMTKNDTGKKGFSLREWQERKETFGTFSHKSTERYKSKSDG